MSDIPLFTSVAVGPVTLPNRIVISPMCQYSADDGCANDWHLMHLMQLALSGAGLIMLEATATERQGRITHGCLGLYNDANERALARVMASARAVNTGSKWGIQIAHAGRKASAQLPWEGRGALGAAEDPWSTEAPSAIPFMDGWHTPGEMTEADIARAIECFAETARRSARLGFDVVEIHAAHGYLIHQFLSPLSNQRKDGYGGSLANRMRFALEVASAVRAALPADIALGLRITAQDWREDGIQFAECVALAQALKALGADYVCVSSGGVAPADIKAGPAFQAPFAAAVKKQAGIATRAVGLIATPEQANRIIAEGEVDMVALARAFLHDPRWVWHAAEHFGIADRLAYPPQYERASAPMWPGAALPWRQLAD